MTDWQNIATARRDRPILVWDGEAHVAQWADETPGAVAGWWTSAGYTVMPSQWAPFDPPGADFFHPPRIRLGKPLPRDDQG